MGKPNHEADIQNANKGTYGTNITYDKNQGNRGKQFNQILNNAQIEWHVYNERLSEISEKIKFYQNLGDEVANKMRYYLSESQSAFYCSEGERAKELSLIGRDYENQARAANAEKDYWIGELKMLKKK